MYKEKTLEREKKNADPGCVSAFLSYGSGSSIFFNADPDPDPDTGIWIPYSFLLEFEKSKKKNMRFDIHVRIKIHTQSKML